MRQLVPYSWIMYPFKEISPPPYTDSESGTNIKPRLVQCVVCRYSTISSLAGPRCGVCSDYMMTVIGPPANDMAGTDSQTT